MNAPIVQVHSLVKVFPGGMRALEGLTLAIQPGIIYGLLGPNGAGKTTLIRVLAILLHPDKGSARVAGFDVRRDADEVRKRIGLAGQYAAVDDFLTGRENVEMIGRLYGLPRGEPLERIRLVKAADRPVKTYSGGMRRQLDLSASLVGRPQLLFLDEPTAGLDPASRMDLWELIEELVDLGTTVLLTTQYLDEADRLADRIAVIDQGRLVREGSGAALVHRAPAGQHGQQLTAWADPRAGSTAGRAKRRRASPAGAGMVGRHPGRLRPPGRRYLSPVDQVGEHDSIHCTSGVCQLPNLAS